VPRFMLIIWTNGEAWGQMSQEEQQGLFKEYSQYTQWLQDQGWFQHGDPLQPPAKTVQVRNGKTQVTDGPFAETKEYLGGYYMLESTEKEALEAAARLPDVRFGAVEVHEVMPVDAAPGGGS
jgi:hypothetical protein